MAKKTKEVEVEVKGASLAYPGMPEHNPVVQIKQINNGYVISTCCGGSSDEEFVANFAKAPSIIKKLFDVGNKSGNQIAEMTKSK